MRKLTAFCLALLLAFAPFGGVWAGTMKEQEKNEPSRAVNNEYELILTSPTVTLDSPTVGSNTGFMDIELNANSHMVAAAFMIEFDHDYFTAQAHYNFTGSLFKALNAAEAGSTDVIGTGLVHPNEQGGVSSVPLICQYGEEGKWYTDFQFVTKPIDGYASTGGILLGGKLMRLRYTFTALPEYDTTFEMKLTCPIAACVDLTTDYAPQNIHLTNPKVVVTGFGEAPEDPNEYHLTYTGETVDQKDAVVGDEFNWYLSISENSSLYSADMAIEFPTEYMDTIACASEDADPYEDPRLMMNWINIYYEEELDYPTGSAIPGFNITMNYEATGSIPGTVAGNIYNGAVINSNLNVMANNGLQFGGEFARYTYKWTKIPAADDEGVMQDENGYYLPVNILMNYSNLFVQEAPYWAAIPEEQITCVPGKIYFTPEGVVEFTVGSAEAMPGDIVSIPITLGGADFEVHSFVTHLYFDPTCLELLSITNGEVIENRPDDAMLIKDHTTNPGDIAVGFICPTIPATAKGVFYTLNLKIKDNCTTDQILDLVVDEFYYFSEGSTTPISYPVVVTDGMVTIINVGTTETPTPEPTAAPTPAPTYYPVITRFDFEYSSEAEFDWTLIDSDGDGYDWFWLGYGINQTTANMAYEGVGNLTSASYQGGVVLYPDNWAITPAVAIPDDATTLTFWVKGQDPSYADEHYAVYVGTAPTVSSMMQILPESVATGDWVQKTIDISDYAGETVYFGFRHFNSSDMFRINLDLVEIHSEGEPVNPTSVPTATPTPGAGEAVVVLEVEDVWGDGSGYQMLLDSDANTYGSIIPTSSDLTSSGNASAYVYAEFEYKIPENADGNLNTSNIILASSGYVVIPAGTYDWCITNPTPGDRMWIASSNGSVPGRYDNFQFQEGGIYVFHVSFGGQFDQVDLTVYGDVDPTITTVNITYTGAYTGTEVLYSHQNAALPVLDAEGLHYTFTVNGEPWDGTNVTEDVTVEVGIAINEYTVTFFDPVANEVIETQTVEHGNRAIPPEPPEYEGCTFVGWDADTTRVTSDMVVNAIYDLAMLAVTFTDGIGNVLDEQSVPYGTAAMEPDIPEREGCTFAGWDADFSCVTEDMTVNALWEVRICTITYVGVYTGTDTVEYGGNVLLPYLTSPTMRYTFTVNGEPWDGTNVTDDVTVTVGVELITFTVTFLDMDGTVLKLDKVRPGNPAIAPEPPEHEGYTFIGWDKDFSEVTEDMTVTAVYQSASPTPEPTPPPPVLVVLSAASGWPGEEVSLDMTIRDYFEVDTLEGSVEYDSSVLTLTGISYGSILNDAADNGGTVIFNTETPGIIEYGSSGYQFHGSDYGFNALLFTLTFRISEDAEPERRSRLINQVSELGRHDDEGTYHHIYNAPCDGYVDICGEETEPSGWRFTETDQLVPGAMYVLAAMTDAGPKAIKSGSGAATLESVTIRTVNGMPVIDTGESLIVWERTGDNYFLNGSRYLYPTSYGGVYTYTSGRAVSWSNGHLSFYTSAGGTYYITQNGDGLGTSTNEDEALEFRLFVKTCGLYTVTFVDGVTGEEIAAEFAAYGESVTAPEPPEHEGYTFIGWDKDFSEVTEDMTVTAVYEYSGAPAGLSGDVDCDGLVTMADVTLLAMYLNGEDPEITAQGLLNADANGDGGADIRDIAAIYAVIAEG